MKRIIAILICLTFTTGAFADEIDRAAINYKGTDGIFFSEDIATQLLIDVEEYESQERKLKLLDTKLELKDEKIGILELEVQIVDEIAEKYKTNYTLEHKLRMDDQRHYEKLLKKKSAWYKSPGLWFGVGFVVASALAVGLSFSLQEARE